MWPFNKKPLDANAEYHQLFCKRVTANCKQHALVRLFMDDMVIIGRGDGEFYEVDKLIEAKKTLDALQKAKSEENPKENQQDGHTITIMEPTPIVGTVRWFQSFKVLEFKAIHRGRVIELHGDGNPLCGWDMNSKGDLLTLRTIKAYKLTYISTHMHDKLCDAAWTFVEKKLEDCQIVFK